MSGGQCKNDILIGLIANATGFPVCIPKYIDAAVVLGAAMLGAKAASENVEGQTKDLWAIMCRMSQPGTVVDPSSDEREVKLLKAKYKVRFLARFDVWRLTVFRSSWIWPKPRSSTDER